MDNSGAETQYKIAMSSDGQVYYEVGAVDSRDEMAFAVHEDMFGQPLTPGATYWFKVMAVNGDNASGWSEPASATTPV